MSLWYFWKYLWTWLDIKSSKLSEYAAELTDMTCWHMMDIVIDFSSQVLRLFELTCLLHFSPFFLDYLELFLLRPGPVPGLHSIHFFSAHLLRSNIHSPYWSALDFWKSLCLKMQVFKLDFFFVSFELEFYCLGSLQKFILNYTANIYSF